METQYNFKVFFAATHDIRAEGYARSFLAILAKRGVPFIPRTWERNPGLYEQRFETSDVEGPVREWWKTPGLVMQNERKKGEPDLWCAVKTYGDDDFLLPRIYLSVQERVVRSRDILDQLVGLALDLYELIEPVHGDIQVRRLPLTSSFTPPIRRSIPDIYWVNFFGRPYVELLGADRLRTAPCDEIKEMADGGFMLRLTPAPLDSVTPDGRLQAQAVKEHLGIEYFWHPSDGLEYSGLRQRATPAFDLCSMPREPVPLNPYLYEQRAAYHGLHKLDPEQLIADVPDLTRSLRERLGARGSCLDYSEGGLRELDSFIREKWLETTDPQYWKSREFWRELAAYVGDVVKRVLDGEWKVQTVSKKVRAVSDVARVAVVEIMADKCVNFDPIELVGDVLYWGVPVDIYFAARLSEWLTKRKLR